MDSSKIQLLKEKIQDAELILVGIGEEWRIDSSILKKDSQYDKAILSFGEKSSVIPYVKKAIIEQKNIQDILMREECYQLLAKLLENKNYFVVSLCDDALIMNTELKKERIVMPCGTLSKMQCKAACHDALYESDDIFTDNVKKWLRNELSDENIFRDKLPVCPKCGQELVFNTIEEENYLEAGYLPAWQTYMKWLQGTVNKKVCVLELGVGMKYPTVIRWPFEKITFFNQKATHFRIHSKLYQTAEEIKEKSYGIQASFEDFFRELSTCD